jgi:hypothetical protein
LLLVLTLINAPLPLRSWSVGSKCTRKRCGGSARAARRRARAELTWDVQLPGEDLPHRTKTDHLLRQGETIRVDGRQWRVEAEEIEEAQEMSA